MIDVKSVMTATTTNRRFRYEDTMPEEINLPQLPDGLPVRRMVELLVTLIERAADGDPPSQNDAEQSRDSVTAFNRLWDVIELSHTQLRDTAENALRGYSREMARNSDLLDEIRRRDEEIERLRETVESLTRRN